LAKHIVRANRVHEEKKPFICSIFKCWFYTKAYFDTSTHERTKETLYRVATNEWTPLSHQFFIVLGKIYEECSYPGT